MHKIFANTIFLGKQLISLPSCHSTNDHMALLTANNKLTEGAIVITDHQTKGKGQRGNQWLSKAGENLTFSLLLCPHFLEIQDQFQLNRVTSLAIRKVLKQYFSVDSKLAEKIAIKWPNDIYVGKQKIAGILIENTISRSKMSESIVGIGLNVNQLEDLPANACSMRLLRAEGGDDHFDLSKLLEDLIHSIEHYYLQLKSNKFVLLREAYEEALYLKGKVAVFEDSAGKFNGIIIGVSPEGLLKIQDESEQIRLYHFKEVKYLT